MLLTREEKERFIERFIAWAEAEPEIRLALLIGSHARTNTPADEWSDLDIPFFTAGSPDSLLYSSDWLSQLGTPWLTFLEGTAGGEGLERRVLFRDGLDVDFPVFSIFTILEWIEARSPRLDSTLSRGVRVLVDKENLGDRLHPSSSFQIPRSIPDQATFDQVVHDFLYHAVWTAKKLCRGELWTAIQCCNCYMKSLLRKMIEWHSWAVHGPDYDTWHSGRFLEQWADEETLISLRYAFPHYDLEDICRSLLRTTEIFMSLSEGTAERWSLVYSSRNSYEIFALLHNYVANIKNMQR